MSSAPHPVPASVGGFVKLADGTKCKQVESSERPFGDRTRIVGEFSFDDLNVNFAALMQNAAATGYKVTYSVTSGEGGVDGNAAREMNQRIAQDMLKCREYENYQMMQRSRKVFDTTHHTMVLELLSKSGESVKDSVTASFPLKNGGYDEYRETIHGDKTDIAWWLSYKKGVMTKPEHLPPFTEVQHRAAEWSALADENRQKKNMKSDLPDHLAMYPRPMCHDPPQHGESVVLMLQGDLERPVFLEDKQLYRVRIVGLAGTRNETHETPICKGRNLREYMNATFKKRRQCLDRLQQMADQARPGSCTIIEHCTELVSGAAMLANDDSITCESFGDGKAILNIFPLAWSCSDPKTRRLMITGIVTCHLFSRPPREVIEVEKEVCSCCLEDIAGESWSCAKCNKCMHSDCFAGWGRMCRAESRPVTCPNCRSEVA